MTLAGLPIGPGFRVPLMLVSPWTRSHGVCSQMFDHTSVVRFVEQRFGVRCPNISPWRRAVLGDLTACFDFANPDYSWPALPNTSGYVNQSAYECDHLPAPVVPAEQSIPVPEPGTRVARPLPYEFAASIAVGADQTTVAINNTGLAGAAFSLYNYVTPFERVRKYAVEAGKRLAHSFATVLPAATQHLALHGPNGWVREFCGAPGTALDVQLAYDTRPGHAALLVTLANLAAAGGASATFTLADPTYAANPPASVDVPAAQSRLVTWPLPSHQWYDLAVNASATTMWRAKGHLENGMATTSDPALAQPLPGPDAHPPVAARFRNIRRPAGDNIREAPAQKDAWFFDASNPPLF